MFWNYLALAEQRASTRVVLACSSINLTVGIDFGNLDYSCFCLFLPPLAVRMELSKKAASNKLQGYKQSIKNFIVRTSSILFSSISRLLWFFQLALLFPLFMVKI